ncbi:MAG: hypothetical protein ACSLE4_10100 [Methyloceanibacter sp.]|uniref:hypothetical protein n=1 Tax=Methyloceanibacter sp. TaxID=1965321 RepID=UPI003EDED024
MLTLPMLSRALPLAALLAAASVGLALESAVAQQQESRQGTGQGVFKKPHRGPAIGGTSWTLSDVWGEPEMPEPSMDYPGYDYPPGGYDLNGPPSRSPYPN